MDDITSSPLSAVGNRTPTPPPVTTPSTRSSKRSSTQKKQPALPSPAESSRPTTSAGEPSRRSGRSTKRTYKEESSEDELVQDSPPPPTKKVKSTTPTTTGRAGASNGRKQPLRGNFSPDYLMKNPNSILAKSEKVMIRALLQHPTAWASLDRSEQLKLIKLLPGYGDMEWPDDLEIANYPGQQLSSNTSFKDACTKFQTDLADGRYQVSWLQKAQFAMQQRIKGTYDSWKERETEAFWGQKQKVDWNALAGDSSKYKLSDLVKANLCEVGDVWRFTITRGKNKAEQVTVAKEAVVTSVDRDAGTLSFRFPPGQYQTMKDEYEESKQDLAFPGCDNPTPLLVKMMEEDGRVDAHERMSNAWRFVRVMRRNMDLGALFDLRERHALKMEKAK